MPEAWTQALGCAERRGVCVESFQLSCLQMAKWQETKGRQQGEGDGRGENGGLGQVAP